MSPCSSGVNPAKSAVVDSNQEPADPLHAARKPLAAIVAFAELLHDELAGPLVPLQKEHLGVILERADELGDLLVGLLSPVAPTETKQPEWEDEP